MYYLYRLEKTGQKYCPVELISKRLYLSAITTDINLRLKSNHKQKFRVYTLELDLKELNK